MNELYVVELRTHGWRVGVSKEEEERVLTHIFRLSKRQKNRLQALKVRFYRALEKLSVFTLENKYVVPQRKLPEVEKAFREIYSEFAALREEIFSEIAERWEEIEPRLLRYAEARGISIERVRKLRPTSPDFLEMEYTIIPLRVTIDGLINASEEVEKLAKERDEYRAIAERMYEMAERIEREIRNQYEKKLRDLEKHVEELRKITSEKDVEIYRLKLKLKEEFRDVVDVASFLGKGEADILLQKLKILGEVLAEEVADAEVTGPGKS